MKVIGYEAEQDCVEIGGEESSMGYHFKSEKNKAAKDVRAKARPERKNQEKAMTTQAEQTNSRRWEWSHRAKHISTVK